MSRLSDKPESTQKGFKMYCKWCKRNHIMVLGKCGECGVYEVPEPKSDAVNETCRAVYRCDGCEAYADHLR